MLQSIARVGGGASRTEGVGRVLQSAHHVAGVPSELRSSGEAVARRLPTRATPRNDSDAFSSCRGRRFGKQFGVNATQLKSYMDKRDMKAQGDRARRRFRYVMTT